MVRAPLAGCQAARRASYPGLTSGLKRMATRVGHIKGRAQMVPSALERRGTESDPGIVIPTRDLPRYWPDCPVTGARPARLAAVFAFLVPGSGMSNRLVRAVSSPGPGMLVGISGRAAIRWPVAISL